MSGILFFIFASCHPLSYKQYANYMIHLRDEKLLHPHWPKESLNILYLVPTLIIPSYTRLYILRGCCKPHIYIIGLRIPWCFIWWYLCIGLGPLWRHKNGGGTGKLTKFWPFKLFLGSDFHVVCGKSFLEWIDKHK